MRIVFIVDDNLIGNKKAIKAVLREVVAWQEQNGYPLTFFTEASIDLADDPELMELMVEANIISVFVGIESPNEASLRETKKFQNVRAGRDDGREGPPHPGRRHGGLVRDDHRLRQRRRDDLRRPGRVHPARPGSSIAMIGMLYAIPKTPLYDRLAAEGRLDPADEPEFGTNVIPLKLGREELRDGYVQGDQRPLRARAYFGRLDELFIEGHLDIGPRGRSLLEAAPLGAAQDRGVSSRPRRSACSSG